MGSFFRASGLSGFTCRHCMKQSKNERLFFFILHFVSLTRWMRSRLQALTRLIENRASPDLEWTQPPDTKSRCWSSHVQPGPSSKKSPVPPICGVGRINKGSVEAKASSVKPLSVLSVVAAGQW